MKEETAPITSTIPEPLASIHLRMRDLTEKDVLAIHAEDRAAAENESTRDNAWDFDGVVRLESAIAVPTLNLTDPQNRAEGLGEEFGKKHRGTQG